ncbi:o-succinylbenzoate synthase [Bacillus sp. AFS017336]|uniref:o-succinylbenzoate synthase n=1 Tax=Bacillus sp. AFS017336 TaxID=2033489 RepID=UPI000BEF3F45|nr:o-succinylbenzoate synthase [Bacillus sp. AFS017336]PEK99576.1 o-succinylbenzoate synthase [Bacillus sp. AFS017336]
MLIQQIELFLIEQPLKIPFKTSYGTYEKRESIIVKIIDENGVHGFGEVVAFSEPWYTEETIYSALHVLQDFLIPKLLYKQFNHPSEVALQLNQFKGNQMAKAGLESAYWDLYSKQNSISLAQALGGNKAEIPVGVVISIDEPGKMTKQIGDYLAQGYERFKIKVSRENDYEIVSTIRNSYPTIPLMIDANSDYSIDDIPQLRKLDQFNLMMIEQPFGERQFIEHAILQKEISTPVCLDESICSIEDVQIAHELKACKIITVKPGRVGGLTKSIEIHRYCVEKNIPIWVGGMIETGISRIQNVALASLPGFTIPGDISASSRHWERDIIYPEVALINGKVRVPDGPGIGVEVDEARVRSLSKKIYRHA